MFSNSFVLNKSEVILVLTQFDIRSGKYFHQLPGALLFEYRQIIYNSSNWYSNHKQDSNLGPKSFSLLEFDSNSIMGH